MSRFWDEPPGEILARYYAQTWNGVFPSEILQSIPNCFELVSLDALGKTQLTVDQINLLNRKVSYYQRELSPRQRWSALSSHAPYWLADASIVDIGAGNGALGNSVSATMVSGKYYSIDPTLPERAEEKHILSASIESVSAVGPNIWAIFCFSLHHMTPDAISSYIEYLLEKGCARFSLIEDTFLSDSDSHLAPHISYEFDALSKMFVKLSSSDKYDLFRANDYVANVWTYGRPAESAWAHHRSGEEWIRIFEEFDLRLACCTSRGFDYHRLHGVPSAVLSFERY